jgi:hypothetical protein
MALAAHVWRREPALKAAILRQPFGDLQELDAELTQLPVAQQDTRLMLALENHPVVAAYAMSLHDAGGPDCGMEWDIFLDSQAPHDLRRTKVAHGSTMMRRLARLGLTSYVLRWGLTQAPSAEDWLQAYAQTMQLLRAPLQQQIPPPLYLDIKSGHTTPAAINAFVWALRRMGIEVRGVGSFSLQQTREVTVVDRLSFFHGYAGILRACRAGRLRPGSAVMFNGGMLLVPAGAGSDRWQIDAAALAQIEAMQREYALQIGLYVQEYDASPQALEQLVRCVNRLSLVFSLGFAYGGTAGFAQPNALGCGVGDQRRKAQYEHGGWRQALLKQIWPPAWCVR